MIRQATPGGMVAQRRSPTRIGHKRRAGSRSFVATLSCITLLACGDSQLTTVSTDTALVAAEVTVVSGDAQSGEVGTMLANPLVVAVTDDSGAPVPGVTVMWSFASGAGSIGQGQPANIVHTVTDASGQTSTQWQLGTVAGPQTASAELSAPSTTAGSEPALAPGGKNKKEFRANGRAGSANAVAITPETPAVMQGESLQLSAEVTDRFGNVLTESVNWQSSDETVATVNDQGEATGVSEGSTNVRARVGSVSETTQLSVQTTSGNAAPSASIPSPSSDVTITLGESVNFQGSASDPDGTVASHSWSFGDGNGASVEDPGNHTYGTAGNYAVTYQVTDDAGAQSAVATRSITVVEVGNATPTAWIESPLSDVSISLGEAMNFQGSFADPDGSVVSHAWDFGDGNGSSAADPGNHTYASTGTYSVLYRVTDDGGATSQPATRTVTVTDGGSPPPPPPPPPPGDYDFVADWAGSDWRDNGTWTATAGANHDAYLQVFGTEVDPDVPGGRGMRVVGNSSHSFWNVANPSNPPRTPQVGETITWEFWHKIVQGDGDGNFHPHGLGTAALNSQPSFLVATYAQISGAWQPQMKLTNSGTKYAPDDFTFRLLSNVWYRHLWIVSRVGQDEWTMSWVIYDSAGRQLIDGSEFTDEFGSGTEPLSTVVFRTSNAHHAALFEGFNNGVGGVLSAPHESERYGPIRAYIR